MKILAIETSCDETAVSIIDARGGFARPRFSVLGNRLFSQAHLHAEYGGVFPNLAKREHGKSIVPLIALALKDAELARPKKPAQLTPKDREWYEKTLEREKDALEPFLGLIEGIRKPRIDALAVTAGPGLEPALWVGINIAKGLARAWNLPLYGINHMEGHIIASLLDGGSEHDLRLPPFTFPALALLISGGHTELVLMKDRMKYKRIGATRDDAVGEAFDKVARMLDLPYPGGPHISKEAKKVRDGSSRYKLPRPMINSNDLDFSFSGIKTAVLYTVQNIPHLTETIRAEIANEFEMAVTEVLIKKTLKAATAHNVRTIMIGGGVSANERIRTAFEHMVSEKLPNTTLHLPPQDLSTDNALMIAIAAYFRSLSEDPKKGTRTIRANGNLSL